MKFIPSNLDGVILIVPNVYKDERGFFLESYKQSEFKRNGISEIFIQDNHSYSSYGVLRGLHYQLNPKAQGKLVRCIRGQIFDVAVDIRRKSFNYGKWVAYELSATNYSMLYIPPGFAHGFLTISQGAELVYKVTDEYSAHYDRGIKYDDPEIDISWPNLTSEIKLSPKDASHPLLCNAENNFV